MKRQTAQILDILEMNGSLTPLEAMQIEPPCFRLAARVWELVHEHGYPIRKVTQRHSSGTYAKYVLDQPSLGL